MPSGLYHAWLVACNDCAVMFRSRIILMFVVAVPLVMVLITGLVFKGLEPLASRGGQTVGFHSFSQAVVGNGVLFILLNCVMGGSMGLAQEKRRHTLDRLLIAPMSRGTLILGKVLGVYLVGLMQAAVIFGFGLVVGVALGDLVGVILITLAFILVGCTLGLMVSSLARREESVQLVAGPLCMVMAALGGGLFPFGMSPEWMQNVALLLPTGWAMWGYHQLMWEGKNWLAVLPNLAVLAGFAALFLAVGVRRLQWE